MRGERVSHPDGSLDGQSRWQGAPSGIEQRDDVCVPDLESGTHFEAYGGSTSRSPVLPRAPLATTPPTIEWSWAESPAAASSPTLGHHMLDEYYSTLDQTQTFLVAVEIGTGGSAAYGCGCGRARGLVRAFRAGALRAGESRVAHRGTATPTARTHHGRDRGQGRPDSGARRGSNLRGRLAPRRLPPGFPPRCPPCGTGAARSALRGCPDR
jgi:hypothetical protein